MARRFVPESALMFRSSLVYTVLAVSVPLAVGGCLHFEHPTPDLKPEEWRACDEVPNEAKSSLYVFMFDGFDPLCYSNVAGVRDHLISLGFNKIFYGCDIHRGYFAEKMMLIQHTCPNARFAVIGYHGGADSAQAFTTQAAMMGISVDLLMLVEPRGLTYFGDDLAFRQVTVLGDSCRASGAPVQGEVVTLSCVDRAAVPTHPETLDVLMRELTLIAMTIPITPPPEGDGKTLVTPIPAPRPVKSIRKPLTNEWNFLRPHRPFEMPALPPIESLPQPRIVPDDAVIPLPKPSLIPQQ